MKGFKVLIYFGMKNTNISKLVFLMLKTSRLIYFDMKNINILFIVGIFGLKTPRLL